MQGKGSPETGRSRSSLSSELPHVKQEMVDSDEEEKKEKRTLAELRKQLKECEARAVKAEKALEEAEEEATNWFEQKTEAETLRLSAEARAKELKDEVARSTVKYQEIMAKYNQANASAIEFGNQARAELEAAGKLRVERDQARDELRMANLERLRAKDQLAEASDILNGLTSTTHIKIESRKPLTHNETVAMQWRYKELVREAEQLRHSLEESKKTAGLMECQRDELKLKLDRMQQGPVEAASEITKDLMKKLDALEKGNTELREEHTQLMAKAEKGNKEAQLVVAKLQADNEDLQDRLTKLADRQERNHDGPPSMNNAINNKLMEDKKDLEDRLQKLADRLDRQKKNCRCDQRDNHDRPGRHSGKFDVSPICDRSRPFLSPIRDRSHNSESDDLRETVKRLEKDLAEMKRAKGVLECERNELRSELKKAKKEENEEQTDAEPKRDRSRDRSHNSESDELRELKELRETVKRLEKAVEDGKRAHELLEQDRDDFRASLKRKREESDEEKKISEGTIELLNADLRRRETEIMVLRTAMNEIRERLEKEEQKTKDLPKMQEDTKMLTNTLVEMEDEKKQLTAEFEREKKRLEAELEEKNTMNTFLVTTPSGKLNEELTEARKKIEKLESELETNKPGCSKEKRARLEELKETIPAHPFVLQAAAAPTATAATENKKGWKRAFHQPLQPQKDIRSPQGSRNTAIPPIRQPHPAFAPPKSRWEK